MENAYITDLKTGLQVHCKTVQQLCEKIGVTHSAFNRWCRLGITEVQKLRINIAYKKLCGEEVKHWEMK